MEICEEFITAATPVPNRFIDEYMAQANGEYVKVYIYLLRHVADKPDLAGVAEALCLTEADVKRAVGYWAKKGVLKTEAPAAEKKAADEKKARPDAAANEEPLPDGAFTDANGVIFYSQENTARLSGDEDFSLFLYIAQKYLSKTFTQHELSVMAYLYDGLGLSCELLEHLVEKCVQEGHTSMRYIEKTAIQWKKDGIATKKDAAEKTIPHTDETNAIMRAFGLSDRRPAKKEKEYISRWFDEMCFAVDIVTEACDRTMEQIHTPSFAYADRILDRWREAGVKVKTDIDRLDRDFKEKKESAKQENAKQETAPKTYKPRANRFHNFEERDTDYDSILRDRARNLMQEA